MICTNTYNKNLRKLLLTFTIFLFLILEINYTNGQEKKTLKLTPSNSEQDKILANYYNAETGRLLEQWTIATNSKTITTANFEQLLVDKKIWAHGKYIKFHSNSRIKKEGYCENGEKIGDFKEFYPLGQIKIEGNIKKAYLNGHRYLNETNLTFYNINGSVIREEKLFGGGAASIVKYYANGKIQAQYSYSEGFKNDKYISYYINGNIRRKAKFEFGKKDNSKCFDENEKKIDCSPIIIPPSLPKGFDFKKEINKINFQQQKTNTDTTIFKIKIAVDTSGKATFVSYDAKNYFDMEDSLKCWVNQLPIFTPTIDEVTPSSAILYLSFPISGTNAIYLGDLNLYHKELREEENYELDEIFYFDFPHPDNGEIFFKVDKKPTFPMGSKAYLRFLKDNQNYPPKARDKGIEGSVYVSFHVQPSGKLSNFKIEKSVDPLLDNAALELLKKMPDWIPGSIRNQNVRVFVIKKISYHKNLKLYQL